MKRAVFGWMLTLLFVVTSAGGSFADDGLTAGISAVKSSGTEITGVLTLRSTELPEVDVNTLTADVGGKKYGVQVTRSSHTERRSMLVIDTSGSMGTSGMATVRAATATYLSAVPKDVLVGVASFADTAGVDLEPTADRKQVQRVVDGLVARGNTSLYGGMQKAIASLGNEGDRSIVLLSDGADTTAPNEGQARAQTVAALKRSGVRVDVVRFRTTDADATAALRAFAGVNGGSVVSAGDARAVSEAFRASAQALESQLQFRIPVAEPQSGKQTIRIGGDANGKPFEAIQVVDMGLVSAPPSDPVPTPAPQAVAPSVRSVPAADAAPWMPTLAAVLAGLGLLLLGFFAFGPQLQTKRDRRLALIESYAMPSRRVSRSELRQDASPIADQIVGLGDRFMKDRASTSATLMLIDRADLPIRAGEWFVLRIVAVIVCSVLGVLLLGSFPLLGLGLGCLVGFGLPSMVLRTLASRRSRAFERQLPDVLSVAATSLSSGFGLNQALDSVARDSAEPSAKEFSRVLAETRIGTDVADALERMAERMDSTAMGWVVMAIRIQRDVGGNLAETLRTTVSTLREREALNGQVRALSAEGRLSAYILMALPVALFLYMLVVSRDYVALLWTRPLGIVMMVVAIVLSIIGFFWMRRVARIEV